MKPEHAQNAGSERKHPQADLISAVRLPLDIPLALQPLKNVGSAAGGDAKKLADLLIGQTTGGVAEHVENLRRALQRVAWAGSRGGHREHADRDSGRYGFSPVRLKNVSRE